MAQNSLTEGPIKKLIIKLALPAMIGFFFNTMYNVVDTYYGGQLSTEALAALSLSFPVFFLIIAIGSGVGSGTTALIGHATGAGDKELARRYADQALTFVFTLSVFLMFAALKISPWLFELIGATGEYLSLALSYTNVIFYGTIFFMFVFFANAVLNASGDTKTYSKFLIFGFFLNLLLDPWFMYGWFGMPALGLSGVAWATVLIQVIGTIYLMYKVVKAGLLNKYFYKNLKPDWKIWRQLAGQGFPASLSMMTVAIGIFIITYYISSFGKSAVAAYGIATRIEQVFLIPTIGINIAVLTLIAQNAGAKKYERVREVLRGAFKYTMQILGVGAVVVFIFAPKMMAFFTTDKEVVAIGVRYLHIAPFIFLAYGFLFLSDAILRALKHPLPTLFVGIFRQMVGPLIVFPIFIYLFKKDILGLWFGIFFITWVAGLFSWTYMKKYLRRLS